MGIVTCAIFAPKSKLQKLLSRSNDPVFPFLPPLQPIQSYLTATDLSSNQSRGSTETLEFSDSFPLPQSDYQEEKNAIIIVGDDVSNTIRVYRNSEIL